MTDSEKLDFLIAEFARFGGRVDRLDERFDRLEGRSDRLETRFDALEARFGTLELRFDKIEGTVAWLVEQLTRLRVDVMARIDRLQEELRALRDDNTVNAGAAARLWKMLERDRETEESTQQQIFALQRMVRGISERLRVVEERELGDGS